MKWVVALALCLAAIAGGVLLARRDTAPGPTHLLVVYEGQSRADTAAHGALLRWAERLRTEHIVTGVVSLGKGGFVLGKPDTSAFAGVAVDVLDPSADEATAVVYLRAPNRPAAMRFVRDCPVFAHGGHVVLREIASPPH